MKKRLEEIKIEARRAIKAVTDETRLSRVKAKFVGRKGQITALLKQMRDVPDDEKPAFGQMINEVKDVIEAWIEARSGELREEKKKRRLTEERIDITIPGRRTPLGGGHPVTLMMEEVVRVFMNMGFEVAEGPEVELDYYNFEALNIPKDHPARDMQDTFYISDEVVLRTHTSPVQIRVMEKRKPPVKIIAPGKVYRCDSDVSHTPMFHQVEGLLVDSGVSFGDLKGVLRE